MFSVVFVLLCFEFVFVFCTKYFDVNITVNKNVLIVSLNNVFQGFKKPKAYIATQGKLYVHNMY